MLDSRNKTGNADRCLFDVASQFSQNEIIYICVKGDLANGIGEFKIKEKDVIWCCMGYL